MSYILDALKKSERERQQGQPPGLTSIHDGMPPAAPRRSLVPILGFGSIMVTGALLAGFWWAEYRPGASTSESSSSPETALTPVVLESAPVEPLPPPVTEPTPAAVPEAAPARPLWELPDDVQRALPAMTFSFHVHASDPARRAIIINNRRLREGERVDEDVLVEEITEDGVVLRYGRHRIHIPVLADW